jgi:hypothetical protein
VARLEAENAVLRTRLGASDACATRGDAGNADNAGDAPSLRARLRLALALADERAEDLARCTQALREAGRAARASAQAAQAEAGGKDGRGTT